MPFLPGRQKIQLCLYLSTAILLWNMGFAISKHIPGPSYNEKENITGHFSALYKERAVQIGCTIPIMKHNYSSLKKRKKLSKSDQNSATVVKWRQPKKTWKKKKKKYRCLFCVPQQHGHKLVRKSSYSQLKLLCLNTVWEKRLLYSVFWSIVCKDLLMTVSTSVQNFNYYSLVKKQSILANGPRAIAIAIPG